MQYQRLGQTELTVSKICFGALGIGPLQANLPLSEGAAVLKYAFECGVNFLDTAELYNTYPYIAKAISSSNKDIIIATKSYAYTAELMEQSFEKARKSLNRDYIDIFLLHEQESEFTIKGHWEALQYLLDLKSRDLVKAVGISTHHIAGVKAAANIPEIDIIHPLINLTGLGIADGCRSDMEEAINQANNKGKGIYTMKSLGGGNLITQTNNALDYVFSLPVNSVAIGMKSFAEVDYNIAYLEKGIVEDQIKNKVNLQRRTLFIESWCQKCGKCVKRCSQGALHITSKGVVVDANKCLLCGYCSVECPDFCIKII